MLDLVNREVLLDDPPCIVVEVKLESGSFIWLFRNRDFLCILVLVHRHIVSTFHNCNRCHNTANYQSDFILFCRKMMDSRHQLLCPCKRSSDQ